MRLYRALYARGTAAAIVIASWAILATAQVAVVFGAMQALHPSWPPAMQALAAVGYELATLAVGLVIAVRAGEGRRQSWILWVGLALFVGISSWMGFDAAMRGQLGEAYRLRDLGEADAIVWLRAVLGGAVLPLQYLLAVAAGHQLAARDAARDAPSDALAPRDVQVFVQGDLVPTFAAPHGALDDAARDASARAAISDGVSRDTAARRERVVALAAAHPAWSRRKLAAEANVSDSTVRRMEGEGLLRQGEGGWETDGLVN